MASRLWHILAFVSSTEFLHAFGNIIGSSPKIGLLSLFLSIVTAAKGTVASSTSTGPLSSARATSKLSKEKTFTKLFKLLILLYKLSLLQNS